MSLFDKFVAGLFGASETVADRRALADFMDSRAAFLCQKCVVEFCRVRAGVYWQKLFSEAEFQEKLRQSRWQSYPPAFAMVAEMVEGATRSHAGQRQRRLPAALETVAAEVFARYPVPDGAPVDFWDDALVLVRERLQATQAGPPRPVKDMTSPSARMIFEALPLHKEIVAHDFDYIRNNLRMNLLRFHEDFVAAARFETLVPSLLGEE
ncbi:type II toxin-antitoxin system VapC family toxin [Allomesorhizobium camelthorni]|uniref:Type II toxin-antitoxin system VapC family toxin n=1 Tax=Allomesorhizobium camelthorni TaxID=475069 RepID=A0A6G4WDJ5_9HYPH|nr:type II toxin-antitoxin system VapC family toxin [Mesorhizobium camelthorni]NGO52408.1 type II toxin-antitoxin system VapC family toxin [Mesorhizobium camelthorni]